MGHGVTSTLRLNNPEGRKSLPKIPVAYLRGTFILGKDEGSSSIETSLQYVYEDDWKRGKIYSHQRIPIHAEVNGMLNLKIKAVSPYEKDREKDGDDLLMLLIKEALE